MRLVGGQSAYEGRVEVCLSQRWGTVTDDGWSLEDAKVVCRQLGYQTQGIRIPLILAVSAYQNLLPINNF